MYLCGHCACFTVFMCKRDMRRMAERKGRIKRQEPEKAGERLKKMEREAGSRGQD